MSVVVVVAGSATIHLTQDNVPNLDTVGVAGIELAWQKALAMRPWLHDGDIFAVTSIISDKICGIFVPYRYFVVQQEDLKLNKDFKVCPLGVTGRTRSVDGSILLARRGKEVYQNSGMWELAPAGGIQRASLIKGNLLDPFLAIEEELKEELGIERETILVREVVGVAFDKQSGVYEVIVDLQLSLNRNEVEQAFSKRTTKEYDELSWWAPGEPLNKFSLDPNSLIVTVLKHLY